MNDDIIDSVTVSDQFRATMRKYPATVTVITANDGVRDHGMTVTAVSSVSMSPPSLLVCINNQTLLHAMLLDQPFFAVNVLTGDHEDISNGFSGKVEPEKRFEAGGWVRNDAGMMILPSAHANVICKRTAAMPFGTHSIFVGQVVNARVDDETQPLLYSNAAYHISTPSS